MLCNRAAVDVQGQSSTDMIQRAPVEQQPTCSRRNTISRSRRTLTIGRRSCYKTIVPGSTGRRTRFRLYETTHIDVIEDSDPDDLSSRWGRQRRALTSLETVALEEDGLRGRRCASLPNGAASRPRHCWPNTFSIFNLPISHVKIAVISIAHARWFSNCSQVLLPTLPASDAAVMRQEVEILLFLLPPITHVNVESFKRPKAR
jgi:hypothetical protein